MNKHGGLRILLGFPLHPKHRHYEIMSGQYVTVVRVVPIQVVEVEEAPHIERITRSMGHEYQR